MGSLKDNGASTGCSCQQGMFGEAHLNLSFSVAGLQALSVHIVTHTDYRAPQVCRKAVKREVRTLAFARPRHGAK